MRFQQTEPCAWCGRPTCVRIGSESACATHYCEDCKWPDSERGLFLAARDEENRRIADMINEKMQELERAECR